MVEVYLKLKSPSTSPLGASNVSKRTKADDSCESERKPSKSQSFALSPAFHNS